MLLQLWWCSTRTKSTIEKHKPWVLINLVAVVEVIYIFSRKEKYITTKNKKIYAYKKYKRTATSETKVTNNHKCLFNNDCDCCNWNKQLQHSVNKTELEGGE